MASQGLDDMEMLPGTRRILVDTRHQITTSSQSLEDTTETEKHGEIVLIPQPTDSPNDPLNWSLWRKTWHSILVCYVVALTAATSNVAGTASYGANVEFGISYDVFNTGAGVLFVGIGYWTLLSSPSVYLYGRRLLYLVCMLLGIGGNIWFGRLFSASDSIWSQLFVGASESVAEAVVQLSLLDIWFEHQNGTSLAFYTLATTVGTYLGPLVAGYICDSPVLGWRWVGYMGTIMSGFTFVLCYFTLEETSFPRERYLRQTSSQQTQTIDEKTGSASPENPPQDRHMSVAYTREKTYWERIAIITAAPNLRGFGFKQYGYRLWHTMRVFTFPAVWFAGLQWGMQNVALTFYLTLEEDNWYDAPWYYSDVAVGNMNIPCLIGSTIGCFYGGIVSDRFVLWMGRRNNGIAEAEYRLWIMALCALIFPAGMLMFGIGTAKGMTWPVPYVGLGFIGFGYGSAGDLSLTYLADSYPEMVLEGMVGAAVINNSLALVFTFAASYWLDSSLQNCFIELGVISFICMMLFLPMALFGKRARRWTNSRYNSFLQIRDGMND